MWFDRKFYFEEKDNIFPSLIERLWGTPLRLNAMLDGIPESSTEKSVNGAWTIKDNIGHLIDLEPLWQGRLEDIFNGAEVMRPADLENRKTHEANHNNTSLEDLLHSFEEIRAITISQISVLTEEQIFMSALHPRLQKPMRVMDLFYFTAEHDDHHLATIRELLGNGVILPQRR